MAKEKIRTKEISLYPARTGFSLFKKPSKGERSSREIVFLRQFLSREKAHTLEIIKTQNPASIYDLAKKLGRSFKSVDNDIKILKELGFIELKEEYFKKRKRLKPVIVVDTLNIVVKL